MHQPWALDKRPRFPGAIISHAGWLYQLSSRFRLSYRVVEELLAERGITVSDATVRRWCRKCGQAFADGGRQRRPRPGDKWPLDEVQLKSNGTKHWRWRAVDQDGIVLDILVQARRHQEAAEALLRHVGDGTGYRPRVVLTDTLASSPPAAHGLEQPGGALASSHPATSTGAAAVLVAGPRPVVPQSVRPDLRPLPPPPPSPPHPRVPPAAADPLHDLA